MTKPDKKIGLVFGFVPMGQVAPDPIPEGELWIDVGNRVGPRVLDHHGGNTPAWSASQLVLEKIEEMIVPYFKGNESIRIILHSQPDLDSICGAWLVKKAIVDKLDVSSNKELYSIVQIVSENDQGLIKTNDAISCWPIVLRSIIGCGGRDEVELDTINSWFAIFDKTLAILETGGSFADAAEKIITPELRTALAQEQRDYEHDVRNGIRFQLMLLLQKEYSLKHHEKSLTKGQEHRVLCDALYLRNPVSLLFKELARGDIDQSKQRKGFSLLVVSWDVQLQDGRVYQRYIISTDPLTGINLNGLGSLLEKREQQKEDQLGRPYLPGRERVKLGEGRFGGNVVSPWYDGRGHNFTIVDSPSIQINGGICVSQLDNQEVLEILWTYGDPARFIRVIAAELIRLFSSYKIQSEKQPEHLMTMRDYLIKLPHAYCGWTGEMLQAADDVFIQELPPKTTQYSQAYSQNDQKWEFFNDTNLFIRRALLPPGINSLHDITAIFQKIRNEDCLEPSFSDDSDFSPYLPKYIVKLKLSSADPSISRESAAYKLELYRIAAGQGAGFPKETEYDISSSIQTAISGDGRYLFALTENGYVLTNYAQSDEHSNLVEGSQVGECILPLSAYVLSIKSKLAHLSEVFFGHVRCRKTSKMEKLLLEDREKLFWLEQKTQVQIVSENPFIQKIYKLIKSHMDIEDRFIQATKQIGNLAIAVKEARASILTKISFILSIMVPPLLLTFSFFGGRFLDRDFKDKYRLFIPERWLNWVSQHLGLEYSWVAFILILTILYLGLVFLWTILGRKHRKRVERVRVYTADR